MPPATSGAARGCVRFSYVDLFAFSNDPDLCRRLVEAGAAGVVVDWEHRGKRRRQSGHDTQINADSPDHLAAVRAATHGGGRVLCRINRWAAWSAGEIDLAVALGADEVLLPMVRRPEEVDAASEAVGGRCGLGILVETVDAVRRVDDLVERPLARVYVGLNDLMIDRGGGWLFAPLVDGTVDRVARSVTGAGIPFGMAGLTLPDRGFPVPSRLLMGALTRAGASFTFLRRSFLADVAGRDLDVELSRMREALARMSARDPAGVDTDHRELASFSAVSDQAV